MHRSPIATMVVLAVMLAACSSGDGATPGTAPASSSSAPEEPATVPTDGDPGNAAPEEFAVEDIVGPPDWEPTTRSEELLVELASTDVPTVQQAVDAFSLTYRPMPGASPTDLAPGDGVGTQTALALIEAARPQLSADQLAVLDEIDAGVLAEATLAGGGPDPAEPPTSTTESTTASGLLHRGARDPGAAAIPSPHAPPDDPQHARYFNLLNEVRDDWVTYRPDFKFADIRLEWMSSNAGKIDMDTTPITIGQGPSGRPYCRIRVYPLLWSSGKDDDDTVRVAFAHEVFHCIQSQWRTGEFPPWLIEGSASFAAFDLYRRKFLPPDRYAAAGWFSVANRPLAARTYDAWPLFQSFLQFGGDPYEAVRKALSGTSKAPKGPPVLPTGPGSTTAWLGALGMDDIVYRATWSSNSLRSTSFTEDEWFMFWPSIIRAGPKDNKQPLGVRGQGAYSVRGTQAYSHTQVSVTMAADVGLVVVIPKVGPLLTHAVRGTVAIPEGASHKFCFDPGGCVCPTGETANADQMSSNEMIFSFAARDDRPIADVLAVKWDPKKYCREKKPKQATHNGDPHLVTFDGLSFDVMARGEFVLARDEGGGFEVQARHESPLGGTATSVVAVGVDDHRVTFTGDLNSGAARVIAVDGDVVADASSGFAVGDARVEQVEDVWTVSLTDGTSVSLRWHRGWFTTIALAEERAGRIVGMLGTPDGDFRDDLTLTSGLRLNPDDYSGLDELFAPQWYVTESTTLFDYAAGQSIESFRRDPPKPPSIDDEVRAGCAAALPRAASPSEIAACAYDVAATGDDGYVGVYSQVVTDRLLAADEPLVIVTNPMGGGGGNGGGGGPTPDDASTIVLSGMLFDGLSSNDPAAVDVLSGSIEVAEGSVIAGKADRCNGDVSIRLRATRRETGEFTQIYLCDPSGFNVGDIDDEVFVGEAAMWASAGGVYDLEIRSSSPEPLQTRVTVATDPSPTIVSSAEAIRDGFTGRLQAVADTVVLMVDSGDQSLAWATTGLTVACGDDVYGTYPLGEGPPTPLGVCFHTDAFYLTPTGGQVVPFVLWSRSADPVDVSVVPSA